MGGKLKPRFRSTLDDLAWEAAKPDLPVGTPMCPRCGEPDLDGVEFCSLCGMGMAQAPRFGVDVRVDGVWLTPGPHGILTYRSVRQRSRVFRSVLMLALVVASACGFMHLAYYAGLDTLLPSLPVSNETWADWIARLGVEMAGICVLACLVGAWWTSRAYRNLIPMQVRGLRLPLWAARIGWLVPLANVWISKLLIDDLWRASNPSLGYRSKAWRKQPPCLMSNVGWVGLVGGLLLVPLSYAATPEVVVGHEGQQRVGLLIGAAGFFMLVLGFGVLAALVDQITDRQEARVDRLGTSPHPSPLDHQAALDEQAEVMAAAAAAAEVAAKSGRLEQRPASGDPLWGSY